MPRVFELLLSLSTLCGVRNGFPFLCLPLLLAMASSPAGTYKVRCPPPSQAELNTLAQRFTSIYFFASWCPFCPEGLRNSDPKRTLFIPFRDASDAASACLTKYQPQGTCFLDPEGKLAQQFSVEEVQAFRTLVPQGTATPIHPAK